MEIYTDEIKLHGQMPSLEHAMLFKMTYKYSVVLCEHQER